MLAHDKSAPHMLVGEQGPNGVAHAALGDHMARPPGGPLQVAARAGRHLRSALNLHQPRDDGLTRRRHEMYVLIPMSRFAMARSVAETAKSTKPHMTPAVCLHDHTTYVAGAGRLSRHIMLVGTSGSLLGGAKLYSTAAEHSNLWACDCWDRQKLLRACGACKTLEQSPTSSAP